MRLGVVGESTLAEQCRDVATEMADERPLDGSAATVVAAEPDAILAVGETALLDLVRAEVSVPVLPIEAGPGYGSVPAASATEAVESLLAGSFETESRAILGVSVDGERAGRALADAMLVTKKPADISEYAVRSADEEVAAFRADGVVVSTPTGSHGYGRSAGGPLLEPDSGVVGVVPVAPFAVNPDHWVVSTAEPVTLSVEREESEVSLLLDDREAWTTVAPHEPVTVTRDGSLTLAVVWETTAFFER